MALIASGRVREAMARLASPAYVHDAAAQLLRASCLHFEKSYAEAAEAYQRCEELGGQQAYAARLGRAWALVELGRAAEALSLGEALLAEHANDPDLAEACAFALKRLGREPEAARAHRRFLRLAARRANLRERAARPWS
jgi:predicted Zn-dependent protease